MKKILLFGMVFAIAAFSVGQVSAISAEDWFSIINNSVYYNGVPGSPVCSSTGSTAETTTTSVSGSTVWSSTASQPYYIEEFIINVLEDLAQAEGVPVASTVTQEHVVALVAWAMVEGGNIGNSNAFNLWNMGFFSNYPQLYVGGAGASDGSNDSFVSFDAGVQASVIAFTSSDDSRIGQVLSDPSSTAEQVLHAIAYPDEYSGNEPWAWGDVPSTDTPQQALQYAINFDHTVYITSLLDTLDGPNGVRANYDEDASIVIGPGEEDAAHVPASNLQFDGGTSNESSSTTSTSGANSCSAGVPDCTDATGDSVTGDAAILCAAEPYQGIYYEWGGGHQGYSAFIAGCPDPSDPPDNQPYGGPVNGDPSGQGGNPSPCGLDCSGLLSVAVDSAFDQNYVWSVGSGIATVPGSGSAMNGSGSNYWKPLSSISQATAGDIVTIPNTHVEIVESVDPSTDTVYTFGAHETGTTIGSVSEPESFWTGGAWEWTGPGSDTP